MTQPLPLPPSLAAWEPWLGAVPGDVLGALGPWLPRLRLLVGALQRSTGEGDGEPDGVAGIARRGSYEQLLLSEWALAEVAPLEFVRRAAQGEHLFLERRRRAEAGSRRSVVLFDCGPDQLGAPRLAQVALLLVFARRAAEAGAAFAWGVLQGPEPALHEAADGDAVRAFLRSRSRSPATSEDVDELLALAELLETPEEVWIVGATRASWPAGVRTISVDEPLRRRDPAITVGVVGSGRPAVTLPLPPPAAQATLLRRLAVEAATPVPSGTTTERVDPSAGLLWAQDGRRLMTLHDDGQGGRSVLAWHVPPNPRSRPGRPRRLPVPPGVPLVGVGFKGRRFHWVTSDGGRALVHVDGDATPRQLALPAIPTPGWFASDGLRPAHHVGGDVALVDARQTLWWVDPRRGTIEALASEVLAVSLSADQRLRAVSRDPVTHAVELARCAGDGSTDFSETTALRAQAMAFFGWDAWRCHPQLGLLAVGDGVAWSIYAAARRDGALEPTVHSLALGPEGGRVVGVALAAGITGGTDEPGLLVLDGSRRALRWCGVSGQERAITRWPAAVVSLSASPYRAQVAAILDDGTVSVRGLDDGVEVLDVAPVEPAP